MKKILTALLLLLFAVPFTAQAHTGLSSSNPAEGETVVKPLEEITLIFKTQIEEGSTMELESGGKTFTFDEVTASGDTLQGKVAEKELPNGNYVIQWTIIGADGHPIKGEVQFDVAQKIESTEPAVEESPVEESMPAETAAPKKEANSSGTAAKSETNGGSMMGTVLISILAIAIAAFAFKIFKMKK